MCKVHIPVRTVSDRQARSYPADGCAAEVDAPGASRIWARGVARGVVDGGDVGKDARVPGFNGCVGAFVEELEVDLGVSKEGEGERERGRGTSAGI